MTTAKIHLCASRSCLSLSMRLLNIVQARTKYAKMSQSCTGNRSHIVGAAKTVKKVLHWSAVRPEKPSSPIAALRGIRPMSCGTCVYCIVSSIFSRFLREILPSGIHKDLTSQEAIPKYKQCMTSIGTNATGSKYSSRSSSDHRM